MMYRASNARTSLTALLTAAVLLATIGVSGAAAAPKCTKLPSLVDISAMDDSERAQYAKRACNSQLVSYEKVFIPFDDQGRPLEAIPLTNVAADRGTDDGGLVTALGADTDDHGLYLSISASRNTGTSYCSNWSFSGYFRWNNSPPPAKNIAYDYWGMTWAGNQALTSTGGAYGIDNVGTTRTHSVDDILPNEGIVWRFREWPSSPGVWVRHGYSGQSVRQRTCAGLAGNVRIRYFHTYSDASYNVSIGAGSPGSLSISPTSNQWSFSQLANFTY
jgi:hypothetical protein